LRPPTTTAENGNAAYTTACVYNSLFTTEIAKFCTTGENQNFRANVICHNVSEFANSKKISVIADQI